MKEKKRIFKKIFILTILLVSSYFLLNIRPFTLFRMGSFMPGRIYLEKDSVNFSSCVAVVIFLVPPFRFLISFISGRRKSIFFSFLDFYLGISATFFVSVLIKMIAGKERPDFVDRMKNSSGNAILEGRRSFPSGHTMVSFAGAFYLGKASCETIKLVDNFPISVIIGYLGIFIPFFISGLVGYSRIVDNRHDIIDVSAGSVLGLLVPYFVDRMVKERERVIKR